MIKSMGILFKVTIVVIEFVVQLNALKVGLYTNVTTGDCGIAYGHHSPYNDYCFDWHKITETVANIQGGRDAAPGEMPWTVYLYLKYKSKTAILSWFSQTFVCSGVLINEHWILTAGHCVYPPDHHFKHGWVYPGYTNAFDIYGALFVTDSPERRYFESGDLFIHPDYVKSNGKTPDLALIKMSKAMPIVVTGPRGARVNSICLPGAVYHSYQGLAIMTGFGLDHGLYVGKLKMGWTILKGMVFRSDTTQICSGDSGGPLIQYADGRAVVIGITSAGDCKQGGINYYTEVFRYITWITDTIRDNS